MDNSNPSNKSEDKDVNAQNIGGNFTYTTVTGDQNVTTVSVGEKINTDNKIISKLDPVFSNSITEFRDLLKEQLKEKQGTEEQIKKINENIDNIAKELEGVKAPDKKIEDEVKQKEIDVSLWNIVKVLVDVAPGAARQIASMTPLAPVSEAIGKGVGYLSELIKKKLPK
jgi:hypothetical protein